MGVAYFAGLACGFFENLEQIKKLWQKEVSYESKMPEAESNKLYKTWQAAVQHSAGWQNIRANETTGRNQSVAIPTSNQPKYPRTRARRITQAVPLFFGQIRHLLALAVPDPGPDHQTD